MSIVICPLYLASTSEFSHRYISASLMRSLGMFHARNSAASLPVCQYSNPEILNWFYKHPVLFWRIGMIGAIVGLMVIIFFIIFMAKFYTSS